MKNAQNLKRVRKKVKKGKKGDIYVNGDLNNKFQPYFRESVTV